MKGQSIINRLQSVFAVLKWATEACAMPLKRPLKCGAKCMSKDKSAILGNRPMQMVSH